MTVSPTLSTAPPAHPAMDYAFLRQTGIKHLERMAGDLWTDFNTHDPGITILEQVCYALTDLAQRINYTLPDLLSEGGAEAYTSLYTPAQILPTYPVTLNDFRKLVIDIPGVKNAWFEKVETQQIPLYYHADKNALSLQGDGQSPELIQLKGLYRILIEFSELLYIDGTLAQREAVRQAVAQHLHTHRPLGEDFEEIRPLDPEEIQLQARVEIEAVDSAERVLLEIFQRVADYISPPIRFATLSECLAAGKRVDEIFDGPLLNHGFIDTKALNQAQRRTALRTSDLIQEIMDVPGVKAVRYIAISNGGPAESWSLTLDPAKAPRLNLNASKISLERNRLAASVNVATVIDTYYQYLRQQDTTTYLSRTPDDVQPPAGRNRNVSHYYSIQHQFPATYGIGAMGLPDSATPQRKAQAKQLQAYLLFFDQLLANYFTQLAHVKDMFSFIGDPTATQTYFSQAITDPSLGIADIYQKDPASHRAYLQQITENPTAKATSVEQPNLDRRNRFLNHLLARFAEQFTDYSLILYGAMSQADQPITQKLVADKQTFLQDYPQLSRSRGTAFNYLHPWGEDNLAGLERRLRRKLGITTAEEQFYIVEHILLRPMVGDTQQKIPLLTDLWLKDPYSLKISFVFPNWPARFKDPGFKAFIQRSIQEETPAHLSLNLHWLPQQEMTAFKTAYQNWLDKRRTYWRQQLNLGAD